MTSKIYSGIFLNSKDNNAVSKYSKRNVVQIIYIYTYIYNYTASIFIFKYFKAQNCYILSYICFVEPMNMCNIYTNTY